MCYPHCLLRIKNYFKLIKDISLASLILTSFYIVFMLGFYTQIRWRRYGNVGTWKFTFKKGSKNTRYEMPGLRLWDWNSVRNYSWVQKRLKQNQHWKIWIKNYIKYMTKLSFGITNLTPVHLRSISGLRWTVHLGYFNGAYPVDCRWFPS